MFRFGVVGFTSFILDFSLTYICKEKLHLDKYIANTIGDGVSSTYNFILNRIWAFESKDRRILKQVLLYILSMIAGLIMSNGLIYLFVDIAGIHFYIAKILTIGTIMVWNFMFNDLVIFNH